MTLAELPLNKPAKINALPKDDIIAAQLIEQGSLYVHTYH